MSFRFAVPLRMLRGMVPTLNMRLFASWFKRSFATPSVLTTALVLIHTHWKSSFSHAVVTITKSKCVKTKRTYMINM